MQGIEYPKLALGKTRRERKAMQGIDYPKLALGKTRRERKARH
jgi:hypothetical protein